MLFAGVPPMASSAETNALRARLASLAREAERLKALVELAQEDIAAVLALPGASSVPADVPLKELGLDSLMAVELKNRIEAELGLLVPVVRILACPGVEKLLDPVLEAVQPREDDGWEVFSL